MGGSPAAPVGDEASLMVILGLVGLLTLSAASGLHSDMLP
jgi:hypothetical protein